MSNLAVTNDLFFDRTGMEPGRVEKLVGEALSGMDDGELFLEYSQSESVALDDGRIKSASFDTTQGFGLRAVAGEATGYAHASELSEAAIRRAAAAVRAVGQGYTGTLADPPQGTNRTLYTDLNPLGVDLAAKAKLLNEIDAYARSRDPRVRQVMASLSGVWQAVQIIRPDGRRAADIRRWCGSTSRSSSAKATGWRPDRTAPAGASATNTTSIRPIGERRSTRRCARRWSISARCQPRPAR